jgi:hypothetical protein
LCFKKKIRAKVAVYKYYNPPSTWEAEAGRSQI